MSAVVAEDLVAAFTRLALEAGHTVAGGKAVAQPARSQEPAQEADPLLRQFEPLPDVDLDTAAEMLATLSPDLGYDGWVSAGMALHHQFEGSDEGLALWDSWSADGATYVDFDDLRLRWEKFGDGDRSKPLTFKWVVKAAHKAGYSKTAKKAREIAKIEVTPGREWTRDLDRNADGTAVKPTLHSIYTYFSKAPELRHLRFNSFKHAIVITGPLPWRPTVVTGFNGAHWSNADEAHARMWLERQILKEVPDRNIQGALAAIEMSDGYDPLVEMLDALPAWDGVERLDTVLPRYLKTADTVYERAVMRKAMVGAIKRAYEPGCKYEQVPILIGKGGIGKSTMIAKLAMHAEIFGDDMPAPKSQDNVDSKEYLQGKWFVEWAELAVMSKWQVEPFKNFISTRIDECRLKYARRTTAAPRRCTFWGTANERQPLKDRSGNRRFWPVVCKRKQEDIFDVAALEAEVPLLWAEAVYHYRAGEQAFMDTDELVALAAIAQGEALDDNDTSALADLVREWIERHPTVPAGYVRTNVDLSDDLSVTQTRLVPLEFLTVKLVWLSILKRRLEDLDQRRARDIAVALDSIKILERDRIKTSLVTEGETVRVWRVLSHQERAQEFADLAGE